MLTGSRARRPLGSSSASAFAAALAACVVALAPGAAGCSGADQSLVLIGGEKVDAATIDKDPMALLPSGALVVGYLDAATMFTTSFGGDVARLVQNFLPIGPESKFAASRDVVKVYGGMYAMQGADFAMVLQGNFDVDAIRRAADARAMTVAGLPLVKTHYADNDMFTAGNVGFVVLTSHTVLSGNETGMRRALDRLRRGKLERSIPTWMVDLTGTRGAAFALAGDFTTQTLDPAAGSYPFLSGLRLMRVIGNFQPPGLNYAGALTYSDPQSAANAAASLKNLSGVAQFMNLVSSWGLGAVPAMQVAQSGNDVAFTLPLDDRLVRVLVNVATSTTKPATFSANGR